MFLNSVIPFGFPHTNQKIANFNISASQHFSMAWNWVKRNQWYMNHDGKGTIRWARDAHGRLLPPGNGSLPPGLRPLKSIKLHEWHG